MAPIRFKYNWYLRKENKCAVRTIEVKLPNLFFEIMTDQPNRRTCEFLGKLQLKQKDGASIHALYIV